MRVGWSQARVEKLIELWESGKSGEDIANHLGGVTRGAVLGKLHRLGLRRGQGKTNSKRVRYPREAPASVAEMMVGVRHPQAEPGQGVSLIDLNDHQCRYIIEPGCFCGMRKKDRRSSYCDFHDDRVKQGASAGTALSGMALAKSGGGSLEMIGREAPAVRVGRGDDR